MEDCTHNMKLFLTLSFIFFSFYGFAQDSQVVVTLKSGVKVIGKIKELIASDHITIIVAGVSSEIPMQDVASIEDNLQNVLGNEEKQTQISKVNTNLEYGKYEIFDTIQYPDSVIIDIKGEPLTFILIRGGMFNMGYDDRHSRVMKTEPVHQVKLSSYYISKQPINYLIANKIANVKTTAKKSLKPYGTSKWASANDIAIAFAKYTELPFRLVTEAEWEYASLMPFSKELFGTDRNFEWCFDFMGDYEPAQTTNPTGPPRGKEHVFRSYNVGRNKWQRKFSETEYAFEIEPFIRLSIYANKLNNHQE